MLLDLSNTSIKDSEGQVYFLYNNPLSWEPARVPWEGHEFLPRMGSSPSTAPLRATLLIHDPLRGHAKSMFKPQQQGTLCLCYHVCASRDLLVLCSEVRFPKFTTPTISTWEASCKPQMPSWLWRFGNKWEKFCLFSPKHCNGSFFFMAMVLK